MSDSGTDELQHHYAKDSAQRAGLMSAVQKLQSMTPLEVPLVIGGEEVSKDSIKPSNKANRYRLKPRTL